MANLVTWITKEREKNLLNKKKEKELKVFAVKNCTVLFCKNEINIY